MTNEPMTVTSRGVTVRDFVIFQVKLLLDGAKDFVAFWLSFFAITADFLAGRGRRPRLFYSVVRASERFDRWINLHSVLEDMEAAGDGEGLLGPGSAKSETFLDDIERLIRGDERQRQQAIDELRAKGEGIKRRGEAMKRAMVDPLEDEPRASGPRPPSSRPPNVTGPDTTRTEDPDDEPLI